MWSMPCLERNCEKGSEEKRGPILEKNHLGVPYYEKRSCKCCAILSEVLE